MLACGLPPFTITKETAARPPPVNLTLERAGTNVLVSWPLSISRYAHIETFSTLSPGAIWSYAQGQDAPCTRSRILTRIPLNPAGKAFLRLGNAYAQILEPLAPD